MNKQEIGQLLTLASLVDNRTVTAESCLMWHEIVGDIDYASAVEAMQDHYRLETAWFMPAHLVRFVQSARRAELPQTMAEEAPENCGAHRRLPDGTCIYCTHREQDDDE